jgi:hypothetical protein
MKGVKETSKMDTEEVNERADLMLMLRTAR